MTKLVTDLEAIKQLAKQRHDEFEVLRYMLEINEDITDEQLDRIVAELARPIIDAIDCTQCGNCCHSLNVYLTPDDAQQLSQAIHIPLDAIIDTYIDQDSAKRVHEWGKFKQTPCVFLKEKLCTIYDNRPETCRSYPVFTPDFRWTLDDTIDGASICPIIYNVLSEMVKKVDEL